MWLFFLFDMFLVVGALGREVGLRARNIRFRIERIEGCSDEVLEPGWFLGRARGSQKYQTHILRLQEFSLGTSMMKEL